MFLSVAPNESRKHIMQTIMARLSLYTPDAPQPRRWGRKQPSIGGSSQDFLFWKTTETPLLIEEYEGDRAIVVGQMGITVMFMGIVAEQHIAPDHTLIVTEVSHVNTQDLYYTFERWCQMFKDYGFSRQLDIAQPVS